MHRTAVINVVGLANSLIGERTPRIAAFKNKGASAPILPVFPAGYFLHFIYLFLQTFILHKI